MTQPNYSPNFAPCKMGGYCISATLPSDCDINSCCQFGSREEKAEYDARTPVIRIEVETKFRTEVTEFKSEEQMKDFLGDRKWIKEYKMRRLD